MMKSLKRFDQLLKAWKSGRSACELMRVRLEELAYFLQQLIDAQGGDVTLDTSCLSLEVVFKQNLRDLT